MEYVMHDVRSESDINNEFRKIADRVDYISVITNKVCARVRIEDIETIEQEGRRMHIFTMFEEFVCYESIERLAPLLVGRTFYRAKKGLVFNFKKVARIENGEIIMESGRVYALGRNNLIKTRKAYKNYLLGYPPFSTDRSTYMVSENFEKII